MGSREDLRFMQALPLKEKAKLFDQIAEECNDGVFWYFQQIPNVYRNVENI